MFKYWENISLTKRGLSHIEAGVPCQDFVAVEQNNDVVVAVLADGISSRENSHISAEVVTNSLARNLISVPINNILGRDLDDLKKYIIDSCQESIKAVSDEKGLSESTMGNTLLFVYIIKSKGIAFVGQLGDGAIFLVREKNTEKFTNQNKKSANRTESILSDQAYDRIIFSKFNLGEEEICGFMLMSDGLEGELYAKMEINSEASKYFNILTTNKESTAVEELSNLIEQKRKMNPSIDDDISLIILSQQMCREVTFKENTKWLCTCKEYNKIDNLRCSNCGKGFENVYKGIDFRKYGGKKKIFSEIGDDYKKQLYFLNNGIKYLLENKDIDEYDEPYKFTEPTYGNVCDKLGLPNQNYIGEGELMNKRQRKIIFALACVICFMLGVITSLLMYSRNNQIGKELDSINSIVNELVNVSEQQNNDIASIYEAINNNSNISQDGIVNDLSQFDDQLIEIKEILQKIELQTYYYGDDAILENEEYFKLDKNLYGYKYSDDGLYIGYINNEIANGFGIVFIDENTVEIGEFSNGKKDGIFYVIHSNEIIEKLLYNDGVLQSGEQP